MSRFRWRSFNMITWSSKSRRQLPTQRSANSILPGARERSAHWLTAQGLGRADHVIPELRIVVGEEKLLKRCIWPSFPHLLHDPLSTRVPCDVYTQNPSPVVTNDKEAIQDAKSSGRHGEEVHGRDCFAMVP